MAIIQDAETVRAADSGEKAGAISTVVLAFSGDPVIRWIFPHSINFLGSFPAVVEAFGGGAFQTGTAHVVGRASGVALWLPPGVTPDEERLIRIVRAGVAEDRQPDVFALMEQMDVHRPDEPCWHLPLMGVEPARQGLGLGTALLEHMTQRLDAAGAIACLEATSEANRRLYQRHGFEVTGEIRVATSPPMYPMLRHPGPSQNR